jgi:hypothetical protein
MYCAIYWYAIGNLLVCMNFFYTPALDRELKQKEFNFEYRIVTILIREDLLPIN